MSKKSSSKSKKTSTAQEIETPTATATESPEPAKGKKVKMPKTPKAAKPPKERKPSGLDAAAQVLKEAGEPMRCKDMVDRMLSKGLWKTEGKTPAATIYAAILREIQTKKAASRFTKTNRGLFAFNADAASAVKEK